MNDIRCIDCGDFFHYGRYKQHCSDCSDCSIRKQCERASLKHMAFCGYCNLPENDCDCNEICSCISLNAHRYRWHPHLHKLKKHICCICENMGHLEQSCSQKCICSYGYWHSKYDCPLAVIDSFPIHKKKCC